MRRSSGAGVSRYARGPGCASIVAIACVIAIGAGCRPADRTGSTEDRSALKSSADVRAERRAYDGAPPTIPHEAFGASCSACHDDRGQAVTGVGFAPASPHVGTRVANHTVRCQQCHVFRAATDVFVANDFVPLPQSVAMRGDRATAGAPPRIPHRILMRENCVACHSGPSAREEVRTSHPERDRCRQCHVPVATEHTFESRSLPEPK